MSEQNDARQLVVFTLAGEQYGLPIERVHEIIRYRPPRSIASTEPLARGVLNLRGKIVQIYDVAAGLGASAEVSEDAEIVIVDTGPGTIGVIVDSVDEVLMVREDQLETVPGRSTEMIESIAKLDDRLIVLVDPGVVLDGA